MEISFTVGYFIVTRTKKLTNLIIPNKEDRIIKILGTAGVQDDTGTLGNNLGLAHT